MNDPNMSCKIKCVAFFLKADFFFQILEQGWNQTKEERRRHQNISLGIHRVQLDAPQEDPIQKVRLNLRQKN